MTEIYLGNPPANIAAWIKAHSAPAARTATRVWYGNDENVYTDYEIVGELSSDSIPNILNAKTVDIGNTVTSIGNFAFQDSLVENVTIPNNVLSIGGFAFSNTKLVNVTIPNGTTTIGALAFDMCYYLETITIPASVSSIGNSAFSGCDHLTSIVFQDRTIEQVQNIEDNTGDKNYPWGTRESNISVA